METLGSFYLTGYKGRVPMSPLGSRAAEYHPAVSVATGDGGGVVLLALVLSSLFPTRHNKTRRVVSNRPAGLASDVDQLREDR